MLKIKRNIIGIVIASVLSFTGASQAAPLPDGTTLTITPGVGATNGIICQTGSCFGWETSPGLIVWVNIGPGTDSGIVIGKNQVSGGQELFGGGDNSTPGEITAAYSWLSRFGSFSTASMGGLNANANTNASANIFNDTSCSGAGCTGVTELGAWHMIWNEIVIPFGSFGGCLGLSCTPDQLNGIFVSNWTVNPDQTYSMDYSQSAPDLDPSGFGNVPLFLHLEGNIIPAPTSSLPEVSGVWNSATSQFLFIFGKNFGTSPQVTVNGVTVFTTGDDTLAIALLPSGVTSPFAVEVTTPDGMDNFPKVCPALF